MKRNRERVRVVCQTSSLPDEYNKISKVTSYDLNQNSCSFHKKKKKKPKFMNAEKISLSLSLSQNKSPRKTFLKGSIS